MKRIGKSVVMCGMSALFGALFGTPVAAGIFSMEVISVGVLYYAALVPCLFSSFIGTGISVSLGMKPEKFQILEVPEFYGENRIVHCVFGDFMRRCQHFVLHDSPQGTAPLPEAF